MTAATATTKHTVAVEEITDHLRRQYPDLPMKATLAVVERNGGGFCRVHTYVPDTGRGVADAFARDVAAEVGAKLLKPAGEPVAEPDAEDDPAQPKPGVCECGRERSLASASGWGKHNQCPCKRKVGAR